MACVGVTHAMPRARGRGRGKPAHDVHDPKDASCKNSFEAWDAAYKKIKVKRIHHARRDVADHGMETPSVFARYHLESWGVGLKSALVVQKEAPMAVADGATHKDLIMIAKLGSASHDIDVGPLMCVAHICGCTTMLSYDVPCTQRKQEWSNESNTIAWPYLSILQGYMVPIQRGNVARDLQRNVGEMFGGMVHGVPVSPFPVPMLISKGTRQGHGHLN